MNTKEYDNTDRHFKGQQIAEKVICFCRKHPIVLIRIMLVSMVLYVTSFITFFLIPLHNMKESVLIQALLFLLVIMVTLTHHMLFLRLLNFFLDVVIITNYRVIDLRKSIFIHDDKEIIDLHEIQDTKKIQKGILPNFLNYGTIIIVIPSLTTSMHLPYVPRPEYYLNQINAAKRGYILDRRKQKFGTETKRSSAEFHHATSHKSVQYGPKPHKIDP